MCVIIIDVALCDSTYPCVASDLPAGCLRIYPYTYSQSTCEAAEGAMGSCGNVDMQKCEDKQGSKIEKRVCESCVAWSALMRDKDGRVARRSIRREESMRSDSGSEGGAAVVTSPPGSTVSSECEMDV